MRPIDRKPGAPVGTARPAWVH